MFDLTSSPLRAAALALGLTLSIGGAQPAFAIEEGETAVPKVDLDFRPPETLPARICVARPREAETLARWKQWDGERLPDMTTDLIKRDIKRLQHTDARGWYDTIERAITLMAERDPRFKGHNELLERILAMEAAGMYEELLKSQMVEQLAAAEDDLSPRLKNALSHFYMDGIGVDRDVEKAEELLVSAGFAGNADAILTLSAREMAGSPVAAWDVPVELGVTMAFGALVGELNDRICDRTSRIAREYHNGEIVTRNPQLAHDWYRFTADLGDPYAAWNVAQYHLQAEGGFEKDNALLLTYLRQAADAGLSYAQSELAHLYEDGALVPRDLDAAYELYSDAVTSGGRSALIRLALFLERHDEIFADKAHERIAALEALSKAEDAPGWVFSRLAQLEFERHGRWAGRETGLPLLRAAVARGDLDGTLRYAGYLLAERQNEDAFHEAVELLTGLVASRGYVGAIYALEAAYMCRATNSPMVREAAYWSERERATANAKLVLTADEIEDFSPDARPLDLAVIQSQALYGRSTQLAAWIKYLETSEDVPAQTLAFWKDRAARYDNVMGATGQLELSLATSSEEKLAAIGLLRAEYERSGTEAAVELATTLLEVSAELEAVDDLEDPTAWRAEAAGILEGPAREGNGEALELLAELRGGDADTRRAIFDSYADVIEANGDARALIFALPFVDDATRNVYLSRAVGIVPCVFKDVMRIATAMNDLGQDEAALHWQGVARHLVNDSAWALGDLADARMQVLGDEGWEETRDLYLASYDMGDISAARALFEMSIAEGKPYFDTDKAVEMLQAAVEAGDEKQIVLYLSRYRRAAPPVQEVLAAAVDLPRAHLIAATSGDVSAMRVYGRYLRENAETVADMAQSTDWLRRAAEGGDAAAMGAYGEALAFGIGVPADTDAALYWLEEAAANGNDEAAEITRLVRLSADG